MTATLPRVTLNIAPSGAERVPDQPQKVLFVGQMIKNLVLVDSPVGTFTPALTGSLITDIQDDGTADGLFGPRSMIAAMLREGRKENKVTQFDAIVFPDPTAVFTYKINLQFTGTTVTSDGVLSVSLGSRTNHTHIIDAPKDTPIGDLMNTLQDEINEVDVTAPVTADHTGAGTLELFVATRGLEGGRTGVTINEVPPGITGEVESIVVVGVTPVNPNLSDIFDLITEERYQTIVWPETYDEGLFDVDSYKPLIEDLEAKFNFNNKILDGVAIISNTRIFSEMKAYLVAKDTQVLVNFPNKKLVRTDYKGGALLELSYVQSSQVGAMRALRFTEGADIGRLVSSANGSLDNFGGAHLASLPYFNTPFSLLPIIKQGDGFSLTEIAELVAVHASFLENNDANTGIVALEFQTLSTTAGTGSPNGSFRFLNFVDTISGIREYFFNNLKARYRQTRLTLGDLVPNVNIANANSIKAFMGGLYKDLSGSAFVLVAAGEDAQRFFKQNLSVTVDLELGKVTIFARVIMVTQLREIEGVIQIAFSTNN